MVHCFSSYNINICILLFYSTSEYIIYLYNNLLYYLLLLTKQRLIFVCLPYVTPYLLQYIIPPVPELFFHIDLFFLFVVSSFIKISYKLQALEPILINIGIDSKPPLIFESSVFICSVMLLYKIYYKIVIIQQLIMYYILNRCSILGIYLPPC